MDVPQVSRSRGIFEIFVPGVFLLLNIVAFICLVPICESKYVFDYLSSNDSLKDLFNKDLWNIGFILLVVIPFGYLLGMMLRLLKADIPDRYSVEWLKSRGCSDDMNQLTSEFPYIEYLKKMARERLSGDRKKLCDKVLYLVRGTDLKPSKHSGNFFKAIVFTVKALFVRRDNYTTNQNKHFFNFCKVILRSIDSNLAADIQMTETQTLYTSEMFHGLAISCTFWVISLASNLYFGNEIWAVCMFIFLSYLVAIWIILENFRYLRIKEVEVVFAGTCMHEEKILELYR